ncbi:MAG: phosphohistidine phosphatase SixA [Halobacteriovoraceae bacterium]|nr:phosphohistidine phosphatase SixA [Halobacteriovoraceae bacterium]
MGKIYFIRHGIAEDRDKWNELGYSDKDRPLTEKGKKRFKKFTKKLKKHGIEIDKIFTSEYLRAMETAEILQNVFEGSELTVEKTFNHGTKIEQMKETLDQLRGKHNIAFVGHEPELSSLLSFVITGQKDHALNFVFKKGGVAELEFEYNTYQLNFFLSPKLLLNSEFK